MGVPSGTGHQFWQPIKKVKSIKTLKSCLDRALGIFVGSFILAESVFSAKVVKFWRFFSSTSLGCQITSGYPASVHFAW